MGVMNGRAVSMKPPSAGWSPRNRRRGSMLMEFVLVMPILFMLIMLIIQFAQIMVVRQFVAYAAFCSTRSMLCSNPSEWSPLVKPEKRDRCTHQAARRVLAWVNIFGDPETANLRSWDEETRSLGKFSDIGETTISYTTVIYGSKDTHDVLVPGWGQIPESNSVDTRLNVECGPMVPNGRYAYSTVRYDFPLLIPVAGQIIGFFMHHSASESKYMQSKDLPPGWIDELGPDEMIDGMPYITLTETCVLPLPYSTARLPVNAFDYTSYD